MHMNEIVQMHKLVMVKQFALLAGYLFAKFICYSLACGQPP